MGQKEHADIKELKKVDFGAGEFSVLKQNLLKSN